MPAEPIIRSSAPARLDFAGGWTDVAPFALRERGVVVNAAIEIRAEVDFVPGGSGFLLKSEDLGDTLALKGREELGNSGRLDLLKAALRRSGVPAGELTTRCAAPPGSGLGSSGALDVALVAALDRAGGIERSAADLAAEAFELESVDAELPGGQQDQYAAALGGFHCFGFSEGRASVEPLIPEPAFLEELARCTVVCYTGVSRVSSRTIERVMGSYQRGDRTVTGALRALADVALRMADALRAADLARVASLLSENWSLQRRLDPEMRTTEMAALESAMTSARALGGKAAGAGAGGSMFFIAPDPVSAGAAAREAGARLLPVSWAAEGVRVW
jgi:D-glycero-alpha-D-manno-heptose-7-phosphate kinase